MLLQNDGLAKAGKIIFKPIVDFIFFERCALCGAANTPLCANCIGKFERAKGKCLKCYRYNPFFNYCKKCQNKFHPDLIIALYSYSPQVKKIIELMKFNDVSRLCDCFGDQMKHLLENRIENPVIVPIPLSSGRLKFRGYNQCHLLAKSLCSKTSWEVSPILERKHSEFTQVEIMGREARRQNVKNIFQIRKGARIPVEAVLIDDVVTTGATIEEATKVLKKAGVKKVAVIALAMGR